MTFQKAPSHCKYMHVKLCSLWEAPRHCFLWLGPFSNEGHIFQNEAAYTPRIAIWTDWARSSQRAIRDVGGLRLIGRLERLASGIWQCAHIYIYIYIYIHICIPTYVYIAAYMYIYRERKYIYTFIYIYTYSLISL